MARIEKLFSAMSVAVFCAAILARAAGVPSSATAPVTLTAKDAGRVIDGGGREISAGCEISGWVKDPGGIWSAPLPGGAKPSMFLVNGEVRPIAQYPKDGSRLKDRDLGYTYWLSSQYGGISRPPRPWEMVHMHVDPADIPATLDVANAFVNRYHVWDESTVKVSAYDSAVGLFTFASETEHPGGSAFPHDYVIRNTIEGMQPGRWMHDRRANRILYWPKEGEKEPFKAEIPLASSVFKLEKGADGITIRNFKFRLCNRPDGTPGLRGVNPPGIIDANGAKGLVVENCEFRDSAGQGVRLFRSPGYAVRNCKFENLGAGGVVAVESYEGTIEKCEFRKLGTSCASACAILAGGDTKLVHVQKGNPRETGSTRVACNLIEDVPYCGIVLGGKGHTVVSNRIERAMRVLRDGSAIYLSRAENCLVAHNFASDDKSGGKMRHGLYFDEFSRNSKMVFNKTSGFASAVHCHRVFGGGAFSNVLENAGGSLDFVFVVTKDFKLQGNEFVSAKGVSFRGIPEENVKDNVCKGSRSVVFGVDDTRGSNFVVDGDILAFRLYDTISEYSPKWKKITVSVDNPETGKALAEEIASLLPPSAKNVKVVAGTIEEHPDADCAVFAFVPKKEWIGKSPSFMRNGKLEEERDECRRVFVANLEKLQAETKAKGMCRVFVTPFPIDEYTPEKDGSQFGDYANSLMLSNIRRGYGNVAYKPVSTIADAHVILSRRLAAGEKGLVEPDRVTPSRRAIRLVARETVGVMFRDADALRTYR